MKFRFVNKINSILNNPIIVEFVGMDKNEENEVIMSLWPYIEPVDESFNTDIKFNINQLELDDKFYHRCNKIKETIRDALYEQMYKEGWIHVHGSGVKIGKKVYLFIGDTKAGKSSSAFLANDIFDASFIANDDVFMHPYLPIAVGYPAGFGVNKLVGDLLDIGKYARIISINSYWYTNNDMLNMGFKIEPCGIIDKIFFPDFTKDEHTKTVSKIIAGESAKLAVFNNNKTENVTFDTKQFDYINKIECIYVKTQGVCKDYINVLEKEIYADKIKNEDNVCKGEICLE